MSVSSVAASSSAYASGTTSSSTSSIGTSDFLNLLVAQLQNQNPLDPTDTNEFISQITSYASYNQQVEMNDQLSKLTSSLSTLLSSNAIDYLGHTVEAYGDTTTLQDGSATWGYSLDANARETRITIKNDDGDVVWEGSGETSSGRHTFRWDGKSTDGKQLPDGQYTIEVSATDANGESVYGYTTVSGAVTGIDSTSGTTLLDLNGVDVSFDSVIGVKA